MMTIILHNIVKPLSMKIAVHNHWLKQKVYRYFVFGAEHAQCEHPTTDLRVSNAAEILVGESPGPLVSAQKGRGKG
jgi:hypothetical protein